MIDILSSSHSESLTSKRVIDMQTKENKISINVNLTSSNIDYGYINPLMYDDQMALRDYLLGIASQYNVATKPKWRDLKRDSSYLQARDFNDVKDFCYDLFSIIKTNYSEIFTGNPDLFKNLPSDIQPVCLSERGQTTALLTTQKTYAFCIGPEGGWTPDELTFFEKKNTIFWHLGSTILRAETASVSALACAQFAFK